MSVAIAAEVPIEVRAPIQFPVQAPVSIQAASAGQAGSGVGPPAVTNTASAEASGTSFGQEWARQMGAGSAPPEARFLTDGPMAMRAKAAQGTDPGQNTEVGGRPAGLPPRTVPVAAAGGGRGEAEIQAALTCEARRNGYGLEIPHSSSARRTGRPAESTNPSTARNVRKGQSGSESTGAEWKGAEWNGSWAVPQIHPQEAAAPCVSAAPHAASGDSAAATGSGEPATSGGGSARPGKSVQENGIESGARHQNESAQSEVAGLAAVGTQTGRALTGQAAESRSPEDTHGPGKEGPGDWAKVALAGGDDQAVSRAMKADAQASSGTSRAEAGPAAATPGERSSEVVGLPSREGGLDERIEPRRAEPIASVSIPAGGTRRGSSAAISSGRGEAPAVGVERTTDRSTVRLGTGQGASYATTAGYAGGPAVAVFERETPGAPVHAAALQSRERDVFGAMDGGLPPGSWVQVGARRAEAGYLDPALGWVGVRAESGHGGVHAQLIPTTSQAAQVLSTEIDGLHAYLTERQQASMTVSLGGAESNGGSGAGFGTSAGDQGRSGDEGHTNAASAVAERGSPIRGIGRAGAESSAIAVTRGDGHISVVA